MGLRHVDIIAEFGGLLILPIFQTKLALAGGQVTFLGKTEPRAARPEDVPASNPSRPTVVPVNKGRSESPGARFAPVR